MNYQIIGKCSKCGGEVRGFIGTWMSIDPPPVPTCVSCGAKQKVYKPNLPIIEME